ncbi:MAG: hypothetical protein JWP27_762 [Flaviaesturariibacter sp.]|nr:hypothetical protein [Flaviaesturariibacter sp.]
MSPTSPDPVFHPALRGLAKGISVIFHPLFIPLYILLFTLYKSPLPLALAPEARFRLGLSFGAMYLLFPLVTVLLARGLGFIDSIMLRSQKDRIIPYIACGIYYFWIWYVLHHQQAPAALVVLTLAIFLASSAGLLLNAFIKISMHALSVGVAIAFLYLLALISGASFGIYLSIGLFVAGLVCTARLINADHRPKEVYLGLLLGMLSLVVAWMFEG